MTYAFPWDPPSNDYWTSPADAAKAISSAASTSPTGATSSGSGYSPGASPNLSSLTELINGLNQTAQTNANAARVPNNPALEQQSSGNIGSLLKGEIPQDVINQLSQQAAERGVANGSPGSANSNAALLRSLGLTSLDLQQTGQQNLTAADARNPGAPIFDPTTQLLTPYQAGTLNNQGNQLALEWYKALNPGSRVSGGGGSGGGSQSSGGGSPNMAWYGNDLSQVDTSGQMSVSPVSTHTTVGNLYPGTSVLGLPDLGSILGPQDPNYNPAPSNTVTTGTSSSWDPFAGYYQTQPDNTVTTDTSSTYDPFMGYY